MNDIIRGKNYVKILKKNRIAFLGVCMLAFAAGFTVQNAHAQNKLYVSPGSSSSDGSSVYIGKSKNRAGQTTIYNRDRSYVSPVPRISERALQDAAANTYAANMSMIEQDNLRRQQEIDRTLASWEKAKQVRIAQMQAQQRASGAYVEEATQGAVSSGKKQVYKREEASKVPQPVFNPYKK